MKQQIRINTKHTKSVPEINNKLTITDLSGML